MKHIGGFFELELPRSAETWHPRAIALSTGRACLAAILQHLRPRRIHMPFYACDAAFAPAREAGVPISFYALDACLRPADLPEPKQGELLLAVNYFGLNGDLMRRLAERFGRNFIADNSQAFFEKRYAGAWSFNSARKFFGVPDGAYLYAPEAMDIVPHPETQVEMRHLVNRLIGRQQVAYRLAAQHERTIDCSIRAMSRVSQQLLSGVDYRAAQKRRRQNYQALDALLGHRNGLRMPLPRSSTPYCYPLLLRKPIDKAELARRRLYIPTLWREVIDSRAKRFALERDFARRLIPLPIDHRYTVADMQDMVQRLRINVESAD